jgi:hypothetical protein
MVMMLIHLVIQQMHIVIIMAKIRFKSKKLQWLTTMKIDSKMKKKMKIQQ